MKAKWEVGATKLHILYHGRAQTQCSMCVCVCVCDWQTTEHRCLQSFHLYSYLFIIAIPWIGEAEVWESLGGPGTTSNFSPNSEKEEGR